MGLSVYWTRFAENKLEDIFYYYAKEASTKVARKLVNGIVDQTIDLEKLPLKGQIEEALEDREEEFRYLIHKNYKIIYWINEDKHRVEIVNVFDCRRNPTKLEGFV